MSETRYLGVDPGGTTGLAMYIQAQEDGRWNRKQIGPLEHHELLFEELREFAPHVIVCERFTYQQRDKVILVPVEYIGVVKFYSRVTRTKLHFQSASQGKGFWDDKKLTQIGLHLPGQPHANDATRHLLYYFTQELHDMTWVHKLAH